MLFFKTNIKKWLIRQQPFPNALMQHYFKAGSGCIFMFMLQMVFLLIRDGGLAKVIAIKHKSFL